LVGTYGGLQRSTTSFLGMVEFVLVDLPFHNNTCGIMTSSLAPIRIFFSLSTSFFAPSISESKTAPQFVFPLDLIHVLFITILLISNGL